MIYFSSAPIPRTETTGVVDARSKEEAFAQQYLCFGEKVLCLCITFSEDTRLLEHNLWPSATRAIS
jgi:hypothetical protein